MTDQAARRTGVLFDVDGTLVDSNYLHIYAWWRAFRDIGEDIPARDIHRSVGMGADRFVEKLLGRSDDAAEEAHKKHYAQFYDELRALPRAVELLRAVRALGHEVVLASSASAEEKEALVRALDADDVVSVFTSAADADEAKPAPDIIEAALEQTGLEPGECVFVGDTVYDVEAAARAGIPCIALLSGGIGADELRAAGAVAVYSDAAELLAALAESPIGSLRTSGHT